MSRPILTVALAACLAGLGATEVRAQLIGLYEFDGGGDGTSWSAVVPVYVYEIDATSQLRQKIADTLAANSVKHTGADVAAAVRGARALVKGNCTAGSAVVRGTAPSGAFAYVLRCAN